MNAPSSSEPWYSGITNYQWLVLVIASLGWIFDVFEGQIFVANMEVAMPELLGTSATSGDKDFFNNVSLGAFLAGGALGGIVFGALADRIGRTRAMTLTILVYSIFSFATAFVETWWQMAAMRFLVALGVGGEWAVASALVAEVFPARARARCGAIFHASSVLGTYLAVLAGLLVSWRYAFALGALPALLTLWIRWQLKEPEAWVAARQAGPVRTDAGRIRALFQAGLARTTILGVALASVGLATFWGVHIHGKNVMRWREQRLVLAESAPGIKLDKAATEKLLDVHKDRLKRAEMLGMFLVTTGGGLGLVAFGPMCEWWNRRRAFLLFHAGGLVSGLLLFGLLSEAPFPWLIVLLPCFGFLTIGMHAGYAIYFPELFPTRIRSLGSGFCFNVGRIVAAPILLLSGWMQKSGGFSGQSAASWLSLLYLLGFVVLIFAPETKGRQLLE